MLRTTMPSCKGELALVDLDAAVVDSAAQHLADRVVEGVIDHIINTGVIGVVSLLDHARGRRRSAMVMV